MKSSKGFTLIELLVVIAIIGILSSVVLASLSNARSQGQDAAIKGTMAQFGAQAELYYTTNGNSYLNFFTTAQSSNGGQQLLADVETKNGAYVATSLASTTGYIVSTQLPGGSYFCADTNGTVASTTNPYTAAGCTR
jgi:prepilin-type N-terminal cleavage/methylation domain-containing protein